MGKRTREKTGRNVQKKSVRILVRKDARKASGGRTIVVNGRALCANCHKKITHEDRLKRADKKRKSRNTNPFLWR